MDCLKPREDGMVTSFMISRLQRVRHILLPLRRSLEAKHTNPGTLDSAFEFLSSTARGIPGFQDSSKSSDLFWRISFVS